MRKIYESQNKNPNTARLQDPKTAKPDNPVPPLRQDFLGRTVKDAFAAFLSGLLQDKTLTAAVDGKTSKQMFDKDGNGLQMLNVFVHDIKTTPQSHAARMVGIPKYSLFHSLTQTNKPEILTGSSIKEAKNNPRTPTDRFLFWRAVAWYNNMMGN